MIKSKASTSKTHVIVTPSLSLSTRPQNTITETERTPHMFFPHPQDPEWNSDWAGPQVSSGKLSTVKVTSPTAVNMCFTPLAKTGPYTSPPTPPTRARPELTGFLLQGIMREKSKLY